jgi:hypothetical protein
LGRVLFTLAHFCALPPTATAHPTCVFPSLVDDMHIVGHASNVVPFFVIITRIYNIRAFNAADEVCSAWSPQGLN